MLTKPKVKLTHGATVLSIIEHSLTGDTTKARAYAELLLEKLEENDDDMTAWHLKKILDGNTGSIISIATA
jgi:bacterioferritin (cytochrome b1)